MIGLLTAVALVGATVYTGDGPPIREATVLIEGNRIAAVGTDVAIPEGTEVIQAEGTIVTPGFIDSASRLGVVDIALESATVEGTAGPDYDPVRAALRVEAIMVIGHRSK